MLLTLKQLSRSAFIRLHQPMTSAIVNHPPSQLSHPPTHSRIPWLTFDERRVAKRRLISPIISRRRSRVSLESFSLRQPPCAICAQLICKSRCCLSPASDAEEEDREKGALEMRKFVCSASGAWEKLLCTAPPRQKRTAKEKRKRNVESKAKRSFTISISQTLSFSLSRGVCVRGAKLVTQSPISSRSTLSPISLRLYVKRKQTTTKRKAHARDRELEIISKAWPVVVCCLPSECTVNCWCRAIFCDRFPRVRKCRGQQTHKGCAERKMSSSRRGRTSSSCSTSPTRTSRSVIALW